MEQIKSRIISNKCLNKDNWHMVVEGTPIACKARPGQFINIKLANSKYPLFRRPFTIFRCVKLDKNTQGIEVVYRLVGAGTTAMADLRPGDYLDVIGPLGHGFEWQSDKKNIVLIGGGIGSAALFMLGEEISRRADDDRLNLTILLGAKTREDLLLESEFKTLTGKVSIATDDGTYGFHGVVTNMLENNIKSGGMALDCTVYACGPEPMLKALAPLCAMYGMEAQVSIERHMMCGIGVCLACVCRVDKNNVLKRRDVGSSFFQFTPGDEYGHALVCKEGPVFYLDEVLLDE